MYQLLCTFIIYITSEGLTLLPKYNFAANDIDSITIGNGLEVVILSVLHGENENCSSSVKVY